MVRFCTRSDISLSNRSGEPLSEKRVKELVLRASFYFSSGESPLSTYVIYRDAKTPIFMGYINIVRNQVPGVVSFTIILDPKFLTDEMRDQITGLFMKNVLPFISSHQTSDSDITAIVTSTDLDNVSAHNCLEKYGFSNRGNVKVCDSLRNVYMYELDEQGALV
jgi:hypothetical protein